MILEGIVGDADGGGIIAMDGSGWLLMAHFHKSKSKHSSLFYIEEERT
jgi:hypothetical protein